MERQIREAGEQTIDKLTFYRGVLFGLRVHLGGEKFLTHDETFQKAFGAAFEYAKATWPKTAGEPFEMHQDPIFGEFEEAREMLLEGEQDRVLSLMNPRLQKGHFNISEEEAREELSELPHANWFSEVGKLLASKIRSA